MWGPREEGWVPAPGLREEAGAWASGPGADHEGTQLLCSAAGQFGGGTECYFSLLRFLLLLNLLASVLEACMTLLPTWLEGAPPGPPGLNTSSPCGSYSPHTQGLVSFPTQLFNLLSGEVGGGAPGRPHLRALAFPRLVPLRPGCPVPGPCLHQPHLDPCSALHRVT